MDYPENRDPRIVHAQAIKTTPNPSTNLAIYNSLITLYSKSNLHSYALRLFDTLPSPTIVSWTSIISAFSHSSFSFQLFRSMLPTTFPNHRTLAALIKASASLHQPTFGLLLHSLSQKLNISPNPFVASALVSLYHKMKDVSAALKVFDEMSEVDEVCFSSMITGLAQNARPVEALGCFIEMRRSGITSTLYSVSGALRASSELAMLEQCRMVHGHAVVAGLDTNVIVGTGLIDTYGKCGVLRDAEKVFEELKVVLNAVGWNAMMAAFAQQGEKDKVVAVFRQMEMRGMQPDEYSFLAILTAFYNSGMAEEAERWLKMMRMEYRFEPSLEHYTCVVGAMGRAGKLEEAERLAMRMPFQPDAAVWRALLSTSAHHGNADMAQRMSQRLLDINPNDDSAYVIAANVFAGAERWDEFRESWKMMKVKGVRKEGGRSWIEVRGKVHIFLAGDRMHERSDEIYAKLVELMEKIKKAGYEPIWSEMFHKVEEKDKIEMLWYHSEKLAVAFGLLSGVSPQGKPLRIVKNLRICRDCHEAFKYISKVEKKEIIVRDINRYHSFLNGICNCGDYW